MSDLIHKNYKEMPILLREEASNLYEALNSYDYYVILDAADQMYRRNSLPLDKNWRNFSEFKVYFSFFYYLAESLSKPEFVAVLLSKVSDKKLKVYFTIPEISSQEKLVVEACALLGFLNGMSDFLDYKLTLQELGYSTNGSRRAKKKEKKKA